MTIIDLAKSIIAHLPGWECESTDPDTALYGVYVRHPETGGCLRIFRLPNGRVQISGAFPQGYAPYQSDYHITISGRKAPEKIAREIHLRLLERYFPALNRVLEQKAADEAHAAGIAATVQKLAAVIDGSARISSHDAMLYRSNPVMEIRVHGPDSVTVIIKSIPEALAREVCRRAIATERNTNHG